MPEKFLDFMMIFAGTTVGADLRILFPGFAPWSGSFPALPGGSFQYSYAGPTNS